MRGEGAHHPPMGSPGFDRDLSQNNNLSAFGVGTFFLLILAGKCHRGGGYD